MRIHFICTGNVYRSRLAEAYFASKCAPEVQVISSGIRAGMESQAPITPYATYLLTKYGIGPFAAPHWQRTTMDLVQASDVLVFMEDEHRRFCEGWIEPTRQRTEVWGIEDLGPVDPAEVTARVERTFAMIRERTDALVAALGVSSGASGAARRR